MKTFVSTLAVLAFAAGANASIFAVDLGTGAPPSSIGGWSLSPVGADTRPLFEDVDYVDSDCGPITFSPALNHRQVGFGWATWSHGYQGDVYYSNGATQVKIGLPDDTSAFVFYAEPNPFQVVTITAIAQDGTSLSIPVDGFGGANGFGFYGVEGMKLRSIVVTSEFDFAIGEFSCALSPTPGAMALAGIAGLAGLRRRR